MRGKLNRNPDDGRKPAGLCAVDVTAAATFGTVGWSKLAATLTQSSRPSSNAWLSLDASRTAAGTLPPGPP
ncbi:hypothetical protein GCM10027191_23780 [Novilysobacter erysipheiresistens]